MNKITNILYRILRHKYLWTIAIFVLIAGFIDENSMLNYLQHKQVNSELRAEMNVYKAEYDSTMIEYNRLKATPQAYETVARVNHFMKSDDEDVFVIE